MKNFFLSAMIISLICLGFGISGCSNNQTASTDNKVSTPRQTATEFISFLKKGEWNKACQITDPEVYVENCEEILENTFMSFGDNYLDYFSTITSVEMENDTKATVWFGSEKQTSLTLVKVGDRWYYNSMVTVAPL